MVNFWREISILQLSSTPRSDNKWTIYNNWGDLFIRREPRGRSLFTNSLYIDIILFLWFPQQRIFKWFEKVRLEPPLYTHPRTLIYVSFPEHRRLSINSNQLTPFCSTASQETSSFRRIPPTRTNYQPRKDAPGPHKLAAFSRPVLHDKGVQRK